MRAVRFHEFGPPDRLIVEELPVPVPAAGQVVVRVRAAGVNPLDAKLRAGLLQRQRPITLPFLPGGELAGVVAAVGPNAGAWQIGQPVLGMAAGGSYAEYALAQHADIHPLRKLDFEQAAASPLGLLTAWTALEEARVEPGQRVLVQGAAGGVGLFAVQLAVLRGAVVTGTCSPVRRPLVESWGARAADYDLSSAGFDVVIDAVGGETLRRSLRLVRDGGAVISLAEFVEPVPGIRALFVRRGPASGLAALLPWLEEGRVKPLVRGSFPLERAADAHRAWESERGAGRLVLTV